MNRKQEIKDKVFAENYIEKSKVEELIKNDPYPPAKTPVWTGIIDEATNLLEEIKKCRETKDFTKDFLIHGKIQEALNEAYETGKRFEKERLLETLLKFEDKNLRVGFRTAFKNLKKEPGLED